VIFPNSRLVAWPSSARGYWTQSLFAVAASQLFTNVPKLVSVVRLASAKMLGVQALSVTQAVQLAPSPLTVACNDVPNDDGSELPYPHSLMNTGALAVAVATWLWKAAL
jgi:hypothetical protein